MFRNYLKVALRNIGRQKIYSFINIAGLAAGIASCLVISLWILNELSYNRFHQNVGNIHMVLTQGTKRDNPSTPAPLAPALVDQFPEVIRATRYEWLGGALMSYGGEEYYEYGIRAVDSSFFRMFDFPFLLGDAGIAFDNPYSLVMTQETAVRYFGDGDPLGKVLTMDQKREFTVTGVVRNVPANSDLQFDILVPFEIQIQVAKERTGWDMGWGWFSPRTFVTLHEKTSLAEFDARITDFFRVQIGDDQSGLSTMPFSQYHFFFSGTKQYVYIFSAVALLILGMACINFVNLTTARLAHRTREIGLRKVVGAGWQHIMLQFLGEAVLLSFLALGIAIMLVELLLPGLNALAGSRVSFDLLGKGYIIPALIGSAFFIGLIAGAYPALLVSRFKPVRILNAHRNFGLKASTLRRILIVVQFSCSVFLVVATGVVYRQLDFVKSAAAGYDKEHVVNIHLRGNSAAYYEVLRTQMLGTDGVLSAGGSAAAFPYWRWTTGAISWDGKSPDEEVIIGMNYVDYDLIETLKIEMVAGRGFSRDYPSDTSTAFLINQEMAALMDVESAVGARLRYIEQEGEVIGVMRNFHFRPLTDRIDPLVFVLKPEAVGTLLLRIRPEHTAATLESIKAVWERIVPGYPFDYRFLDEEFAARYDGIARIAGLLGCFALIAIAIAGMGLLGLTLFTVRQRTKEIGIRKVLGASTFGVAGLLVKEFLILVVAANVISWPITYYAASRWLGNFTYRTNMAVGTFVLAGALTLLIALITVGFQAVKAALTNPVETLRYE